MRRHLSIRVLLQRAGGGGGAVAAGVASVLVLAAALLAPAFAAAQAPPAPDELWAEFPLAPVIATVPTSTEPAPAPVIETTTQPVEEQMRPGGSGCVSLR